MRNKSFRHLQESLRCLFGGKPRHKQAAALPWRVNGGKVEILLVTSRETGRWVLPKGWPERNEQLRQAALREAAEEAGIVGRIAPSQIGCYYYGKRQPTGMEIRCEVCVFPLEVSNEASKWPDKKCRKRIWVSIEEAAARVKEPDLADLIIRFGRDFDKPGASKPPAPAPGA